MPPPRLTQKDVAREAGVTQATVSLALSNHPAVAKATRRRIQDAVIKLGYQPDPYLSGLAAYRKQHAEAKFQATLAWLSNWHTPTTQKWGGVSGAYFEGASARAGQLGYQLEEHALLAKGMTPARMERILYARNIQGILLPPQPRPGMSLDFCFDSFSAVTFGYTLAAPNLHTVTLHHYRAMEMLVRKLLQLGYKRPGLALSPGDDRRTDGIWSAAFWNEQRSLSAANRIPLLAEEKFDTVKLQRWCKRYKPDVVIASRKETCQWLRDANIDVPGQVGFATLNGSESDLHHAGIWQNLQETGSKAIDFLVNMIHAGERGIPKVRANLLIDATWVEGATVCRKN